MELGGRVVVITGGAGGIGSALARRFAAEGARAVVLADLDGGGAARVAAEIGPTARGVSCDVGDGAAIATLVEEVEDREGPIDLFCSNAGVALGIGAEAPEGEWDLAWRVNTMATVSAARAMIPRWLGRGGGYLLVTASAAGLLTSLGDAAYAATKHALVGLAEWLAITYGDRGIKVSCICPQGVRTQMVFGARAEGHLGAEQVKRLRVIEPAEVADAVVSGIAAERFLILPHPEALEFFRAKAQDYERWLAGMRKFQASLAGGV